MATSRATRNVDAQHYLGPPQSHPRVSVSGRQSLPTRGGLLQLARVAHRLRQYKRDETALASIQHSMSIVC